MSYFSWSKRPPRKFRGKPQWTLDELYISPFTARRRYDEEGVMLGGISCERIDYIED